MDDDLVIKLRSMIADLSLGDRFIGYPMNRLSPNYHPMAGSECSKNALKPGANCAISAYIWKYHGEIAT